MIRPSLNRAAIVVAIAAFAILNIVMTETDADARAGRGQSYRSSSSSRSSSRSSSSSSRSYSGPSSRTRVIPVPIPYGGNRSSSSTSTSTTTDSTANTTDTAKAQDPNAWKYGLIGLAVMLGFFALFIWIIYRIVKRVFGLGKPRDFDDSAPTTYAFDQQSLDALLQVDADFDPDVFMHKAEEITRRLQEAWSEGDMLPVRNYLSQGVYNRYRVQLDLMVNDEKVRNIMADFKMMRVEVMSLDTTASYHSLHVKHFMSSRDATVPAGASPEERQKALAATPKQAFTEVYSFTRKIGVKTNTSRDWLKGECPNCGYIPDNFSAVNKCSSCGSIYNSGEYDWVLSEITQWEEWRPGGPPVTGLTELEGLNSGINRQVIEDRASFLFWRWIEAQTDGSAQALGRDAAPGFVKGFNPGKRSMRETAVGSADLKQVSKDDEGIVRADVEIRWSAAVGNQQEPDHHEHLLTLSMPVALKNPFGLADHSCPSCGAPLPESDSLKCAYCGGALPQVNDDWLLLGLKEIAWQDEDDGGGKDTYSFDD